MFLVAELLAEPPLCAREPCAERDLADPEHNGCLGRREAFPRDQRDRLAVGLGQAEEGIRIMKQYVDTLLVISNDKLRHQFGNLKMKEAFAKADNVLATAAKCITDVINSTGQINVDFADVCTVMRNGGVAILGSATAKGDSRAQKAIEDALNSPLLNDNDISGAK